MLPVAEHQYNSELVAVTDSRGRVQWHPDGSLQTYVRVVGLAAAAGAVAWVLRGDFVTQRPLVVLPDGRKAWVQFCDQQRALQLARHYLQACGGDAVRGEELMCVQHHALFSLVAALSC